MFLCIYVHIYIAVALSIFFLAQTEREAILYLIMSHKSERLVRFKSITRFRMTFTYCLGLNEPVHSGLV